MSVEKGQRHYYSEGREVEIGLVDDDQHLYIPIFDQAFAAPNCPTNYWWTETEDSRV